MKKKLLSLVLAGAMVASTSVSAFADDNREYIIDDQGRDHQVTVTGDVLDTKNEAVPGTITVTVPTSMAFTINKDGVLQGGDITIVNRSQKSVEVVAKEFKDTTSDSKIIAVKDSELDRKIQENSSTPNKRYVSLTLTGNGKSLGLVSSSNDSETGFIDESENKIAKGTNPSLGYAWESNNLNLNLSGRAKSSQSEQTYTPPTEPIKDQFNLVLKIQKTK